MFCKQHDNYPGDNVKTNCATSPENFRISKRYQKVSMYRDRVCEKEIIELFPYIDNDLFKLFCQFIEEMINFKLFIAEFMLTWKTPQLGLELLLQYHAQDTCSYHLKVY